MSVSFFVSQSSRRPNFVGPGRVLRAVPAALLALCLLGVFSASSVFAGTPVVDGLFYGDPGGIVPDVQNYPAEPYAVSVNGSKLYLTYIDGIVYVALVVDRSVNDNTFDSSGTAYMQSADWDQGQYTAGHRCNSEFAEFTLTVTSSGGQTTEWNWKQGYAGQTGGGSPDSRNDLRLDTWRSDTTVSGGSAGDTNFTEPPGSIMSSASSMMWNMNNYASNLVVDGSGAITANNNSWTMPFTNPTDSSGWKSPWFNADDPVNDNPDTVIDATEGYPATGQITYSETYEWEWSMIYEWSVDLSSYGASPVIVVTGRSHHSPLKFVAYDSEGELVENDPFDPPLEGPDPLFDLGDLPDTYLTLLASGGPRHILDGGGAYLGTSLDTEGDGQPDAAAAGDDTRGASDEDGVELTRFEPGGTGTIDVFVTDGQGTGGYFSAFMDLNNDGDFDDTGETLFQDQQLNVGETTLTFNVPSDAADIIAARYRITNTSGEGGALSTGEATSGEVEDYLYDFTPTLASVADLRAYVAGTGSVVVEWQTALERGTVGFDLLREDPRTGRYTRLNEGLLPSAMTPRGGTYRHVDPEARPGRTYRYQLIETEARGRRNTYGPFEVTVDRWTRSGSAVEMADDFEVVPNGPSAAKARRAWARKVEQWVREYGGGSQSARGASTARGARGGRSRNTYRGRGALPRIRINVDGGTTYYLSAEELAGQWEVNAATVKRLIATGRLKLTTQGKWVAWQPAAKNAGIYFYGEPVNPDNIYTKQNVYWLQSARGLRMNAMDLGSPSPGDPEAVFAETVHAEEDLTTFMELFDDPEGDFWLWDYMLAHYEPLSQKIFPVPSPSPAASGPVLLQVELRGATDTGHHVAVTLNGRALEAEDGDITWSGFTARSAWFELDASWLVDGENEVAVQAVLDPGVPYSSVFVDSFDLVYPRRYWTDDDRITFRGDGNSPLMVGGFQSPDLLVLDITNPDRPVRVTGLTPEPVDDRYQFHLAPTSPDQTYLATTLDAVDVSAEMAADEPSNLRARRNRADYLVIAPAELLDGARELADYRAGFGVDSMVVDLQDIYDEFSHGLSTPWAIHDFLSHAWRHWRRPPLYVVLVGEGTYDHKDNTGNGEDLIPVIMVSTPYGLAESDNRFADVEGDDGVPEMVIGRLPVMTSAELAILIDKIKAYEQGSGDWTRRAIMLSDNPDDGGDFWASNDATAALFPEEYDLNKIYLAPGGKDGARAELLPALNDGALFLNYFGHGAVPRLANEGLLTNDDVPALNNGDRLPVMLIMTCVAGGFGRPGNDCLSEELLLHPDGGIVSGWGPTGLSLNPLAEHLNQSFYRAVLAEEKKLLGEAVLQSLEEYGEQGHPRFMMDIFCILGDPMLMLH